MHSSVLLVTINTDRRIPLRMLSCFKVIVKVLELQSKTNQSSFKITLSLVIQRKLSGAEGRDIGIQTEGSSTKKKNPNQTSENIIILQQAVNNCS